METLNRFKIRMMPSLKESYALKDTLLSDVITDLGIVYSFDCGGKGTCGRCMVQIEGKICDPSPAELKFLDQIQLDEGWRLACQVRIEGDIDVFIPGVTENIGGAWQKDDRVRIFKSESPVITAKKGKFDKPDLKDSRSDLKRISDLFELDKKPHADYITAGKVSEKIRELNWEANCYFRENELVGISSSLNPPLGVAVDLGSTKIAAYLMDLDKGKIIATRGVLNPQIAYGADVVTRLQRAMSKGQSKKRLSILVKEALNTVIRQLAADTRIDREEITELTIVGNSAMIHLLLDLPVKQLASPPFVTSFSQEISIKARDIGIDVAPGTYIYFPPLIGGFVGSDNVSMIIGTGMEKSDGCRLGLDIGTNTEVVLTKPGEKTLYIASAPSGPAFEGAHLSSGMRAFKGAVTKVDIKDDLVSVETIDGGKPVGICGSGVIDAVSELYMNKIVNRQGHLDNKRKNVVPFERSFSYVISPGDTAEKGRDIVITQSDISQIQLAKAAISAAVMKLAKIADIEIGEIDEIILAGSFGTHIDIESAKNIGLIPDVKDAKYRQVGNAAGKGAVMMLNDLGSRKRAEEIPLNAKYVELSGESDFNSLFAKSLPFPRKD